MITYLYWVALTGLIASVLYGVGVKANSWKAGIIVALIFLAIGWGAYSFHFQQIFVKRYGGEMTIRVPDGQRHIGVTWKDDNLWIENYDPKTNTCIFSEYSKGNMLQGKVIIKNCNPLMPQE
jgi:hypothetical protein